jgi:hypothetical protein
MSDLLPCLYALMLIVCGAGSAAALGFWAGRWREQLHLLELMRPSR